MLLLQQMLVLFGYMLVGYFLSKNHICGNEFSTKMSWIILNIANPCMIIAGVADGDGTIKGGELLVTAGIAVAEFVILLLLSRLVVIIFKVPKEEQPVYKLMSVFTNMGYMGFPVVAAVYGNSALLYVAIFNIVSNIVAYSWGIATAAGGDGEKFDVKKILNTGLLSTFVAIGIYLTGCPIPTFMKNFFSGWSNVTAPLSMTVIGISLAGFPIRELFTNVRLILFSLYKLILIPILASLVVAQFVTNEVLLGVCMIMIATPVATIVGMFEQQYGDQQELAAKGIALTTVLSVVTIPLVSAIVL